LHIQLKFLALRQSLRQRFFCGDHRGAFAVQLRIGFPQPFGHAFQFRAQRSRGLIQPLQLQHLWNCGFMRD